MLILIVKHLLVLNIMWLLSAIFLLTPLNKVQHVHFVSLSFGLQRVHRRRIRAPREQIQEYESTIGFGLALAPQPNIHIACQEFSGARILWIMLVYTSLPQHHISIHPLHSVHVSNLAGHLRRRQHFPIGSTSKTSTNILNGLSPHRHCLNAAMIIQTMDVKV